MPTTIAGRSRASATSPVFALPLASANEVLGCIGYVCTGTPMPWDRDLVARLRLIAEIFGSAMARQHAEDALVGSEMLKTAILSSLASGVAVLDRQGCVIAMNERWTGLARDSGLGWADVALGEDLLARARSGGDPGGASASSRAHSACCRETCCAASCRTRSPPSKGRGSGWCRSIRSTGPRAARSMTYAEITERKRAELDAQTARAELAHMARVATLGELASSFAHQLNQPLTAIVANAQAGPAADRLGDRGGEVPSVLEDIAADGLRAGTVILRLREMLRKDDPRPVSIDVATLVEDVAALVANDALIREVSLRLSLPPSPLTVHGDRIQLQQAMLNVLMNAFEAVGDGKAGRLVEVDARAADGQRRGDRGEGHRPGAADAGDAHLRGVLYDQAVRHGDGPADRPNDRGGAWRIDPRRQQPARRRRRQRPAPAGIGRAGVIDAPDGLRRRRRRLRPPEPGAPAQGRGLPGGELRVSRGVPGPCPRATGRRAP